MMNRLRPIFLVCLLALLIGEAILWARSRSRADAIAIPTPRDHTLVLASYREHVGGMWTTVPLRIENGGHVYAETASIEQADEFIETTIDSQALMDRYGFRFVRGDLMFPDFYEYRTVAVPHWSLFAVLALASAVCLRRPIRSLRWRRAGRCSECGYDLRGSSQRCPECGTAWLKGGQRVEEALASSATSSDSG